MSVDLVIFDCDGVLVDSEPIANRVLSQMLNEIDVPISVKESARRFIGRSLASCIETIEREFKVKITDEWVTELHRREFEAYEAALQPMPHISIALAQIPTAKCVASSGVHERVMRSLEITGLSPHFGESVFTAAQVERGKPAPDLFLLAAKAMGVSPKRCTVIEDSLPGIAAGRAAGMTVFGYVGTERASVLCNAGAKPYEDHRELPALLATGAQAK